MHSYHTRCDDIVNKLQASSSIRKTLLKGHAFDLEGEVGRRFDRREREGCGGIVRAGKTLRDIKSAWVKEQKVRVQNGKIAAYQVILKITFLLDDTVPISRRC